MGALPLRLSKTMQCDTPGVAELMASLSLALDLASGQSMGHALRTTLIGLTMAEELGLDDAHRTGLFFGLLIKDAGCAGSASEIFRFFGSDEIEAQHASRLVDWNNPIEVAKYAAVSDQGGSLISRARNVLYVSRHRENAVQTLTRIRANAAAQIIRKLGLGDAAVECVTAIDERWDGSGGPRRLSEYGVPLMARIGAVAQAFDVLSGAYDRNAAIDIIARRAGTVYDPECVKVACALKDRTGFWKRVEEDPREALLTMDVSANMEGTDQRRVDAICEAYAAIVDGKSRYTSGHSVRVRNYAIEIGRALGLDYAALTTLSRAALLHDVGKLSVPNTILEKPDKLNAREWARVKRYPAHTHAILNGIPGFEWLSEVASAHNERLNGSGYFRGLSADHLAREMRIIAVADVFDALSTDRPQRVAYPLRTIFATLDAQAGDRLDRACIDAIKSIHGHGRLSDYGRRPLEWAA